MNDSDKNPKNRPDGHLFDPLRAAEEEGAVLGSGLKGSYRKTPVTRIGFGMLGALFLALGVRAVLLVVSDLQLGAKGSVELTITGVMALVMGLGLLALGALTLRSAFGRSKQK